MFWVDLDANMPCLYSVKVQYIVPKLQYLDVTSTVLSFGY